ncbi:hypothetical protein OJ996_09910 [Luteolibacter sp. GHJ8]|uniref:Uncharacterized protein n=1 Tax=Luteolibacter rhizosphaerae TaxID=2989719 RepID=A0ABT3G236_9BACT|nr:hypothetical protein [Luteolibacter rhizosphaerae]MCW1913890.1 hypothetical protein [Luteolibacter rhizosphaerae]
MERYLKSRQGRHGGVEGGVANSGHFIRSGERGAQYGMKVDAEMVGSVPSLPGLGSPLLATGGSRHRLTSVVPTGTLEISRMLPPNP